MKKFIIFALALSTIGMQQVFAYGVGYSAFPMMSEKKMISTEFTGIISEGGGIGLQARYSHKINKTFLVDAGFGLSGGDRPGRLFAGIDYEIFPDYKKQPRFSIKTTLEHAKEFKYSRNIVQFTPTVSKGFSFWGYEGFPYVGMPVALSLQGEHKTYETTMNLNLGITGKLPIRGYNHLTANVETIFNIKDSYSALFMGVSYPLN